ncbi:gamma-glutamyl-gamma-aminobutyrate hydrolase family protein [Streptococcus sp. H31]|uniref:gamma-glutamyl-gamma-aminobutyrate hydrolase family protein n=1 Tax=Streptococcus huangxiaojuni TaxID=3237239 RepID=UPI0034A25FC3
MPKVLIGISANEKPVAPDLPIIHLSSSRNFADGVKKAGGLPVYLPVSTEDEAKDYMAAIDALLLTGGQDVHPSFYGQERQTEKNDYDINRDRFELALIKEALAQRKPILAVCRGMQLLNVALGGTLNQEISSHALGSPLQLAHQIEAVEGSDLSRLFISGGSVNSEHHQSLDKLGQNLVVTARDPRDGTIEAVELPNYPLLAVQWHPEFLIDQSVSDQSLFDDLVEKAKAAKQV